MRSNQLSTEYLYIDPRLLSMSLLFLAQSSI